MRDAGPARQLDRPAQRAELFLLCPQGCQAGVAHPGLPRPSIEELRGPLGARKCRRGQLLRAGAAAKEPGELFCFTRAFTSIMKLRLLTASLPSINPFPLEAEPRSCRASETLVCSLLLPCRPRKQREWSYRWKFAARKCPANTPARDVFTSALPSSNCNAARVGELMC